MESSPNETGPKKRTRRIAAALVLVAALVAAFPWMVLQVMADPLEIRASATLRRFAQVERLRPYRLEADSILDAEEAATWLARLIEEPEAGDSVWQNRPDADLIAGSPLVGEGGPFDSCRSGATECGRDLIQPDSALAAAERGLTDAEREYLRAFGHHPALPALSRLARASQLNEVRAYELLYGKPLIGPEETAWDLPIPRYSHSREFAYQMVGYAAFLYDQGDIEGAEQLFRELISVGLLLTDESVHLIGALIGTVYSQGVGATYLQQLFELTGRSDASSSLAAILSADGRDQAQATSGGWIPVSLDAVVDARHARSIRWSLIPQALFQETCLHFGTVLRGPPDSVLNVLRGRVRDELVRFPEEAWLYDRILNWVPDGVRHVPERNTLRLAWQVARVLGTDRLTACLATTDVFTAAREAAGR